MKTTRLTGGLYAALIAGGTAGLARYATEINGLNVFPIPDGDTGDNMLYTMRGGSGAREGDDTSLGGVSARIARGMLLGARGNSGVILSQFFAGIADGFQGREDAGIEEIRAAFRSGVTRAYTAVVTPTEGTILTVAREATDFAAACGAEDLEAFLNAFLDEARRSLERTPDLLPILKDAGVIDSGGAGLIRVVEGMYAALTGEPLADTDEPAGKTPAPVNIDLFDENTVLEYGYCTEVLLRLQRAKTDPDTFDIATVSDYLGSIGNSVVAIKSGSVVKVHVHTMTPDKVLAFLQKYGEFLTLKIENMMLQHSEVIASGTGATAQEKKKRTPVAVVAVAQGEGVREAFLDFGCDEVIQGGQTMNPSAADFLAAFDRVNADTVFVLPNNGNVILTAKQAKDLYRGSDIRVIPTGSVGDAYAILSMMDLSETPDELEQHMNEAMEGVVVAEISASVRDAHMNGVSVREGDYIGIIGKKIVSAGKTAGEVACDTAGDMDIPSHAVVLVIRGKGASDDDAERVTRYLSETYPDLEVCETDGGQDIYDFILVAE